MFAVITENDKSAWNDVTGEQYHFPKRYFEVLKPGTQVIYYKGQIKDRKYSGNRLSKAPHYFAVARVGSVRPDPASAKGDYYAAIIDYRRFKEPVLAKTDEGFIEIIPESRQSNYFRDAVRRIDEATYARILGSIGVDGIAPAYNPESASALDGRDDLFESFHEGNETQRFVTVYERDPKLRRQAIAIHGTTCAACGFSFRDAYGEYAAGYIHIHHVVPISDLGGSTLVNPESDLIPLCANCHSVVHRRKERTLSIAELRNMIESARAVRNQS